MAPAGRMDDAAAALRLAATRYRANPEGWGLLQDLERALDGYGRERDRAAASAGWWAAVPAGVIWAAGQMAVFSRADYGDFAWLLVPIGSLLPFGVAWLVGAAAGRMVAERIDARHREDLRAARAILHSAAH